MTEPPYLYLTTSGRTTGNPHEIEIWFVAHAGRWYMMSEHPDRSDWVKNLTVTPSVTVKIGQRDAPALTCFARPIDRDVEPDLARAVSALMDAKYQWSSGLIVELAPLEPSAGA